LPTVSVIVPTFNRADVLTRALESVVSQDFADWELLVSDDGSTDSTAATVQSFQDRHGLKGRLHFIRHDTNNGVSQARNRAAAAARGKFLAFLDSDDEWLPSKLTRQLLLTGSHAGSYRLVHSDEIWIRNGVRVNAGKKYARTGGRIFRRCVDLCCISPSTVLVERELFEEMGGFRADFPVCEDYELWLRIAARHEIGFVNEFLVRKYGGHADQLSRRFPAMDYYRAKALMPFLDDGTLAGDDRAYAARKVVELAEILMNGYRKHGNMRDYDEVAGWARKALTQLQIAHSAAERRPLSEASGTL
jgi:glycosyltransferase involved in cell wall biosynthesis